MRRRILAFASALAIVVLAAPAAVAVTTPPVPVSGPTPFAPNCNGAPQPGTLYPNAEVEPWVNANPKAPANMIAVWQQDRWSNGGDYERASDPWVSFGRDGTAYQMALSIDVSTADPNLLNVRDAMLVSTSKDGGRTWGTITPLIADDSPLRLNDKNSLTADPTRKGHAYAVWDRLELTEDLQNFRGPTFFTRTTTAAGPGNAHGSSSIRA